MPERVVASEAAIAGTASEVEAQLKRLRDLGGEGALEHLVWFFDNSMDWTDAERQVRGVAELLPRLG